MLKENNEEGREINSKWGHEREKLPNRKESVRSGRGAIGGPEGSECQSRPMRKGAIFVTLTSREERLISSRHELARQPRKRKDFASLGEYQKLARVSLMPGGSSLKIGTLSFLEKSTPSLASMTEERAHNGKSRGIRNKCRKLHVDLRVSDSKKRGGGWWVWDAGGHPISGKGFPVLVTARPRSSFERSQGLRTGSMAIERILLG